MDPGARVERGTLEVEGGLFLAWKAWGSGEPALVVPSLSWLGEDMEELGAARRAVFYDVRGRGRSAAVLDESLLSLENDVADLEALRAALGLERMCLLGWSYHAAIAMRYALAHPERVQRIVLVGPSAPAARPYFDAFLDAFARRVDLQGLTELESLRRAGAKTRDPKAWCAAMHGLFFRAYVVDPHVLTRMRSSPCVEPNLDPDRVNNQGRRLLQKLGDYDWRGDFRALHAPVLIVHGRCDPVVLAGSEAWRDALPNAELVVLENVGHMPWLEAPEHFFPLVQHFLSPELRPHA